MGVRNIVAHIGQQDLDQGVFRHRHCVGDPGTENFHAPAQKGPCKGLNRSRTIKYALQVGENGGNFFSALRNLIPAWSSE